MMPRRPKIKISRMGKIGKPSGGYLNIYSRVKGGRNHSVIAARTLKIRRKK